MSTAEASHLAMKPCPSCGVMILTLKDGEPRGCQECRDQEDAFLRGGAVVFAFLGIAEAIRGRQRWKDYQDRMLEEDMG